jgi:hypothetical protein
VSRPVEDNSLEALLSRRTAAAAEQARRSDGNVDQEEIDRLTRLARLIELRNAKAPAQSRSWMLAILAGATLVLVSVLLFARVGATEIELEVTATDIGFSLPSQQVLLDNVVLASLGASGLAGVEFPDEIVEPDGSADDGDSAIRLRTARNGSQAGSISINALIPAPDADVWLRLSDTPKQYRLSLRNPRTLIRVDVYGPVEVSVAGMPSRVHDFATPRAIVLRPGTEIVDLDLGFVDIQRAGVTPQVPIRNLSFSRVDEFADRGVSIVRRLSTILSGTLYLEALNGEKRQLRSGEALRFARSEGEIRMVRLEGDHLSVNFHGWVRGMQTGSELSPRSLMPTCLEWLRARHGLTLLWGTTVYLFGLLMAAIRWFKVPL